MGMYHVVLSSAWFDPLDELGLGVGVFGELFSLSRPPCMSKTICVAPTLTRTWKY